VKLWLYFLGVAELALPVEKSNAEQVSLLRIQRSVGLYFALNETVVARFMRSILTIEHNKRPITAFGGIPLKAV
jgi:hypothetical protein